MTEVRPARTPDELEAALAVRHQAFCVEQGVTLDEELDGRDEEAEHLVALVDGRVVGTCRLLHGDGVTRLGRMAVAPEARGRGLASALLAEAEAAARRAGSREVALDAQTGALGLYERAGYHGRGARFLDARIEHLTMVKDLG